MQSLPREIIKYEEILKYDQLCKDFLWKLSPPEWQKQQKTRRQIAEKIKAAAKEKEEEMNGNLCMFTHLTSSLQQHQKRHVLDPNHLNTTI